MRPNYAIELKSFKSLSPTRCKIQYDDDSEDILIYHKIKIQGVNVYRIILDGVPFIAIVRDNENFMFEEFLINELNINLKEI